MNVGMGCVVVTEGVVVVWGWMWKGVDVEGVVCSGVDSQRHQCTKYLSAYGRAIIQILQSPNTLYSISLGKKASAGQKPSPGKPTTGSFPHSIVSALILIILLSQFLVHPRPTYS